MKIKAAKNKIRKLTEKVQEQEKIIESLNRRYQLELGMERMKRPVVREVTCKMLITRPGNRSMIDEEIQMAKKKLAEEIADFIVQNRDAAIQYNVHEENVALIIGHDMMKVRASLRICLAQDGLSADSDLPSVHETIERVRKNYDI